MGKQEHLLSSDHPSRDLLEKDNKRMTKHLHFIRISHERYHYILHDSERFRSRRIEFVRLGKTWLAVDRLALH